MKLTEMIMAPGRIKEADQKGLPKSVLCRGSWLTCTIGEMNANRRVYGREVWDKVMSDPDICEKMEKRCGFGQGEHPAETMSDLMLTSHIVTGMHIEKNNEGMEEVYSDIDILDTPTGKVLNTLIEAKCQVGVSTRAEGDLEEAEDDDRGKYSNVVAEAYEYQALDFTADPSTFGTAPRNVQLAMANEVRAGVHAKKITERISKKIAGSLLGSLTETEAKIICKKIAEESDCKENAGFCCAQCGKCKKAKSREGKIVAMKEASVTIRLEDGTEIETETSLLSADAMTVHLPDAIPMDDVMEEPDPLDGLGEEVPEEHKDEPGIEKDPLEDEKKNPFESKVNEDLSRRHFIKIAAIMNKAITRSPDDRELLVGVVDELADFCSTMNPRFDRGRFEAAAIPDEVERNDQEGREPAFEGRITELSKKHFIKIAAIMNKAITNAPQSRELLVSVVDELADFCASMNPNFDRNRFDAAAIPDEVEEPERDDQEGRGMDGDPYEGKVFENYSEMVDYLSNLIKKAPEMNMAKMRKAVQVGMFDGKPASTSQKTIRSLRISEAKTRAELAESIKICEEIDNSGSEHSGANTKLEIKILQRKLGEAKKAVEADETKSNDEAKALMSMLEKRTKQLKLIGKKVEEVKRLRKEQTADLQKQIEEAKKATKISLQERTKRIEATVTEQVVQAYVVLKLDHSGLKVHENARTLLGNCKSVKEVDAVFEDVKEGMRRDALRPKNGSDIQVTKKVEESESNKQIADSVRIQCEGFNHQ